MSLIQEALRRKKGENLGPNPKVIPLVLPVAQEEPVKPPELSEKPLTTPVKANHAWPVLVISLFVVVLSLAAVGLLLYSARLLLQRWQQTKTAHIAVTSTLTSNVTGIVQEEAMEKKTIPIEPPVVTPSPSVISQSTWPKLKVVGVMARSAVHDVAAIIDDNLVECGDEIRGVKIQSMDPSGVRLVFNNQTQFVRVGQTTLQ